METSFLVSGAVILSEAKNRWFVFAVIGPEKVGDASPRSERKL
jgi:hypothetical protein